MCILSVRLILNVDLRLEESQMEFYTPKFSQTSSLNIPCSFYVSFLLKRKAFQLHNISPK